MKALWLSGVTNGSATKLTESARKFFEKVGKESEKEVVTVLHQLKKDIRKLEWLTLDSRKTLRCTRRNHQVYKWIAKYTLTPLPTEEQILSDPHAILLEYVKNGEDIEILSKTMDLF